MENLEAFNVSDLDDSDVYELEDSRLLDMLLGMSIKIELSESVCEEADDSSTLQNCSDCKVQHSQALHF